MDNLTQTANSAEPTVVERDNTAAAELGKFKDVTTLLQAYNNLQAEFTRRSQRLKELEQANKDAVPPVQTDNEQAPSPTQMKWEDNDLLQAALQNSAVRDAIIADYIKSVANNKGVAFVTGGASVPAARNTPKTIKEAGELVKNFLK